MRESSHLRMITAVAFAGATLIGASVFADSRPLDGTPQDDHRGNYSNDDRRGHDDHAYRENERVTVEGRITNIDRDRDGYRVRLDSGGYGFWIPESALREHRNDFRVGVSLRLGGIFHLGMVRVDAVDWQDRYDRRDDRGDERHDREFRTMRGYVDRVDARRGMLIVRDEGTRRLIRIEIAPPDDRRGGINLIGLRRGDRIELTGDWGRAGTFRAFRIDPLRRGR